MIKTFKILCILFILSACISCIDRIELSNEGGIEIPFIDGYLTDSLEIQKIRLGRLVPFSNKKNPFIPGANLYVQDNEGNRIDFIEGQDYYLSAYEFAAQKEVEYTLFVELNGTTFVSTPQYLSSGQQVESFNYRETSHEFIDEDNFVRQDKGITLSVEMNNPSNKTKYYKYAVDYAYIFKAYNLTEGNPYKTCYNFVPPGRFILHENNGSGYDLDLKYISFFRGFKYKMGIRLTQISMSSEAFEFWQNVKTLSENSGTIFDTPPYTIRGNMNPVNSEKQMRGFFGVYSFASKRIFVGQEDVSYYYPDSIDEDECRPPRPFWPPSHCYNCLANPFASEKTNIKPSWWP